MAEVKKGNIKIDLEIENKDGLFQGGNVIKGTMHLTVSEDTKCNEIFATAKGKGETLWPSNQKGNWMNEEYLNKTETFWLGSEHDNMLKKGDYSFPFHFLLPEDIPSSFEGEHGWITYKVKGKVDNTTCEVKLKVMETHDLNKDLEAKKPIQLQEEETACCCCCRHGPLSYTLTAEKKGFAPGEEIVLFGEINNKASRAVERVEIQILQKTTFRSLQGREKDNTKTIQEVILNGIPSNSTEVWDSGKISIPRSVLIGSKKERMINHNHELKITFFYNSCSLVVASHPLIIGSVPIKPKAATPEWPQGLDSIAEEDGAFNVSCEGIRLIDSSYRSKDDVLWGPPSPSDNSRENSQTTIAPTEDTLWPPAAPTAPAASPESLFNL